MLAGSRRAGRSAHCWRRDSDGMISVRRLLHTLWPAVILSCSTPSALLAGQASDPPTVCLPSSSVPDLLEEGSRFAAAEQNVPAKRCFEQALSRSIAQGDRDAESTARLGLAQASYHLNDYVAATIE